MAAVVMAVVLSGCTTSPPDTPVGAPFTTTTSTSAAPATLVSQRPDQKMKQFTVRVRNRECLGAGVGSGFLISPTRIVTNRHVVAGAIDLDVETFDGQRLSVTGAFQSVATDLAVIDVTATSPPVGMVGVGNDPAPGDKITAVGYPEGGPVTITSGIVHRKEPASRFSLAGDVIHFDAKITHGNSGGPLLDSDGQVVGVVFSKEVSTGDSLALSASTLRQFLSGDLGVRPAPDCSG